MRIAASLTGSRMPGLRQWILPSRTMKRSALAPALGLGYIALVAALGGLRADHVLLGLLGFLDVYNERSRAFLRLFFPFMLTGALYDSMRYYYWPGIAGRVHVIAPYELEKHWFGVGGLTLNELFAQHHWAVLDLACGFAYLVFVAEYVGLALLLYGFDRPVLVRVLARAFLVVNVLGFITYFVYPAAPPWYVARYGLGPARADVQPFAAGASRFDAILGTHFFTQMYGRGVDVYGAYPSLHVAYPVIAAWVVFREPRLRWARAPAVLFAALMCLSAVYLQHHYVVDVLLGALYAAVTLPLVVQWSAARASAAQPPASGSEDASARRSASA